MDTQRSLVGPNGLRKTIIALVTIIAVFAGAAFGYRQFPTADAQDSTANVNIKNFVVEPSEGQPGPQQKERVKVSFDWTLNGNLKKGDKFVVKFPKELPPLPLTFPMKDSRGQTVGTCTSGSGQVECEFNEKLVGKDNVSGKVYVQAETNRQENEVNEVSFEHVGGPDGGEITVELENPIPKAAPKIGEDGYEPTAPTKKKAVEKDGWVDSNDPDLLMLWRVTVPYSAIEKLDEVIVTDQLTSDNHEYYEDYKAGQDWPALVAFQPDAGDVNDKEKRNFYAMTQDVNGKKATFTIKRPENGWKNGEDLRIHYFTKSNKELVAGEKNTFTNEASVDGMTADNTDQHAVDYVVEGGATGDGVDRGSFQVSKTVAKHPDSPAELDDCPDAAGKPFDIKITIQVPEANKGFAFEGTVKAKGEYDETTNPKGVKTHEDERTIEYVETLSNHQGKSGYDSLPAGTTVKFEEVDASYRADNDASVTYEPEVTSGGKVLADGTITIADVSGVNRSVRITNNVKCAPTGFSVTKSVINEASKDRNKLSDGEFDKAKQQLAEKADDGSYENSFPVIVEYTLPEGTNVEELAEGVIPDGATVDGNSVSFTIDLGDTEEKTFKNLPLGTKVKLTEGEARPDVEGVEFGAESFTAENASVAEDGKSVEFEVQAGADKQVKVELENPVEKDRSGLWWLLLLIPVIPGLIWLTGKIPGMSSNPTPPNTPVPGDNPKPGQPGDNPKPGQPGDKPEPQQPGTPEQPGQPGAPGEGRQPIQSVPSGATEKGDDVADFIG